MDLNRRELLGCFVIGASGVAASAGRLRAAEDKPLPTIVSGINPSTSLQRIRAVLDEFLTREIPIGCAVGVEDESGNVLQHDSELAGLLRGLHADYPQLIEFLLHVKQIADGAAYFQVRRASEAQTALWRALTLSNSSGDLGPYSWTLLTEEPDGDASVPLGDVRAAGFRNVFFLPLPDGPRGYRDDLMGVMQVSGGTEVELTASSEAIAAAVTTEIGSGDPAILHLSLARSPNVSDAGAAKAAGALADAISAAISSGRAYGALPSSLHQESSGPYGHYVVLRVDAPSTVGGLGEDQKAFIALLRQKGLAASYGGVINDADPAAMAELSAALGASFSASPVIRPEDLAPEDAAARMVARRLANISAALKEPVSSVTASAPSSELIAAIRKAGVGSLSLLCDAPSDFIGLDRGGVLHIVAPLCLHGMQAAETMAKLRKSPDARPDALAVVSPDAIATPNARDALADVLSRLSKADEHKFVSLEQYRTQVMPHDPVFALLKSTKAELQAIDLEVGEIDPSERVTLMNDARLAWQYFATMTDPTTGFAPATAWLAGGRQVYPYITMWDVGSLLTGLIAAHAIGIIETPEFIERTTKALAHLADSKIEGLLLPRLLTATDGQSQDRDGFDASDVGRLLVCLKILEHYTGPGLGIRQIVERWDLDKSLINRRLHSYRDGEWEDIHDSNYANYLVRGFTSWGFDVEPAYEIEPSDKGVDKQMRVAVEAASRGAVGTEPHVLEEIELGYSDVARMLADMLYTAQLHEHAATGKVVCVSEGPLDRKPWFTYQGLRFGADGDPWTVATIDNLTKYRTADFRDSVRMVSCRGAFLWAAVRRQAYSRTMLDYVRRRARIENLGFASGIYSASENPTAGYSDINTNGIILAAIAYSLGGHRPLATMRLAG